jgi:excisionase family DNA binding protein
MVVASTEWDGSTDTSTSSRFVRRNIPFDQLSVAQSKASLSGAAPLKAARARDGVRGRLLTVDEASAVLNVPVGFVRRLIAQRRIAVIRLGRHVRIAEADLEEFVRAGRTEAIDWRLLRRID